MADLATVLKELEVKNNEIKDENRRLRQAVSLLLRLLDNLDGEASEAVSKSIGVQPLVLEPYGYTSFAKSKQYTPNQTKSRVCDLFGNDVLNDIPTESAWVIEERLNELVFNNHIGEDD
jgi:hypothetical protein